MWFEDLKKNDFLSRDKFLNHYNKHHVVRYLEYSIFTIILDHVEFLHSRIHRSRDQLSIVYQSAVFD